MKVMWIHPSLCLPPHRVNRKDDAIYFANTFAENGWDLKKKPLIGYLHSHGFVQLLSGSHRYAGAVMAQLDSIPVVLRSEAQVREAYGDLEKWKDVMSIERIER